MKIRKVVESSNIHEIGYDDVERELTVTFKGGARYRFTNVPIEVYEGLAEAESVGKYFAQNVKPAFGAVRLGDAT